MVERMTSELGFVPNVCQQLPPCCRLAAVSSNCLKPDNQGYSLSWRWLKCCQSCPLLIWVSCSPPPFISCCHWSDQICWLQHIIDQGHWHLPRHLGGTAVSVVHGIVCRRPRILLGASGSVAAIKVVELAYLLAEFAEVKLVLTKAARHFVQQDDLPFTVHGVAYSLLLWRLTCLLKFVPEIPCSLIPGVSCPTCFL